MAQIETTLAAPFVVVGTAMLALVALPAVVTEGAVTETTVTAQGGAKIIQFERYLRVARAAGAAGATAGAADKLAAQAADVPQATAPAMTPEQQRQWDSYWAWEDQQRFQLNEEKHYLFWPDAPRSTQ